MSPRLLTLFDLSAGNIVLAPDRRIRTIIRIGSDSLFGQVVDRERSNAILVEVEDSKLVHLLARLVARSIGVEIFRPPPGVTRIGVRHDVENNVFGCFALDGDLGYDPIVAVEYEFRAAVATLERAPAWFRGETVENAMLQATGAFLSHARIAA